MRMHQDIRPFPCTVCEQTFRQKAHLQRHEATHGIDSTANRKRRKRPLMEEMNEMNKRADGEEELYRSFGEKRRLGIGLMKSEEEEEEMDVDPMIEPIEGSQVFICILIWIQVFFSSMNSQYTPGAAASIEAVVSDHINIIKFSSCVDSLQSCTFHQ